MCVDNKNVILLLSRLRRILHFFWFLSVIRDLNTMTNQSDGFERELQQVEAEKNVAVEQRDQNERYE